MPRVGPSTTTSLWVNDRRMHSASAMGMAMAIGLGLVSCAGGEPTKAAPRRPPVASLQPSITAPQAASAPAPASATPTALASADAPEDPAEEYGPPLPQGFVRLPETGETLCAGLRVAVISEPGGGEFARFVRVLGADGKRLYEAHGRRYKLDKMEKTTLGMDLWGEFCGDLTGDGVQELVLTEKTMGAHCCYTHYAVSLTSPPKRLLMWEKGDAGTPIVPAKYRPGPAWQIEGSVVMWPPFDTNQGDPVLSYASAPIVPVVFSLVGGEYKLTSLSFPEAYRKSRDAIHAACNADPSRCFGEIIAWIDSLVIGDWDAEKATMKDVDLRNALDRRAAAMKKMLAAQIGSEQRPITPSSAP